MGHEVRTHTRTTASGKTTTVRQHSRADDGAAPANAPLSDDDQAKRDKFERRHQRERQAQEKRDLRDQHAREKAALTGRQGTAAAPRRGLAPGEKRKRRSRPAARAARHAKKAARLWRKHKVRAVAYGALALGEITAAGMTRAWKAARKMRRKRK